MKKNRNRRSLKKKRSIINKWRPMKMLFWINLNTAVRKGNGIKRGKKPNANKGNKEKKRKMEKTERTKQRENNRKEKSKKKE